MWSQQHVFSTLVSPRCSLQNRRAFLSTHLKKRSKNSKIWKMSISFPPGLEPESPQVSEFLPPGLDVSSKQEQKHVSVPVFIVPTSAEETMSSNNEETVHEYVNRGNHTIRKTTTSSSNLPPGMMDSKSSDQTPPGMEKNAFRPTSIRRDASDETKENTDTVASFLVQRMEELSLIKQKHAET